MINFLDLRRPISTQKAKTRYVHKKCCYGIDPRLKTTQLSMNCYNAPVQFLDLHTYKHLCWGNLRILEKRNLFVVQDTRLCTGNPTWKVNSLYEGCRQTKHKSIKTFPNDNTVALH